MDVLGIRASRPTVFEGTASVFTSVDGLKAFDELCLVDLLIRWALLFLLRGSILVHLFIVSVRALIAIGNLPESVQLEPDIQVWQGTFFSFMLIVTAAFTFFATSLVI